MVKVLSIISACFGIVAFAATPEILNLTAKQRYPWNGKVDITYTLTGDVTAGQPDPNILLLSVSASNRVDGTTYTAAASTLSGDTGTAQGTHHVVWDMDAQGLRVKSTNVVFTVAYVPAEYCVIDLFGGANASSYPVIYVNSVPSGGFNTDEYKTTKLVLRLIGPGTFMMCGSYQVTLTKPFYCGVFEVTQRQYELVTGTNPSYYKGDMRPVEQVSWNTIRGDSSTYDWPGSANVDSNSFIGKLQVRTGLNFDLPTEAQWEYACRAGTTGAFNNGGDTENDLKQLGRYSGNQSDGKGGYTDAHTKVGSYQPNAWGLYDMHGNVCEWCLDWYGSLSSGVTDPVGSSSGSYRVLRGGSWYYLANNCTSSYRFSSSPSSSSSSHGFRLARTLSNTEGERSPEAVAGAERADEICAAEAAPVAIDSRTGVRESDGEEILTYSSTWDGGDGATVTIAQDGAAIAEGLMGEGELAWNVQKAGVYELAHSTFVNGVAGKVETATFKLTKDIASLTVGDIAQVTYTGSAIAPDPTVTDATCGYTLVKGTDYALSYANNTAAGTATVTITGKGNYTGSVVKNFMIARRDIADAVVTLDGSLTYNGQAQAQSVSSVKAGGLTVTYTISGNMATDAGTYALMVTGTGNFTGTATKQFTIARKAISGATVTLGTSLTFSGAEQSQSVIEVTIDGLNATFDVSGNTATAAGNYALTVTGTGNFTGSTTKQFAVAPKQLTAAMVGSIGNVSYTGSALVPEPVVTDAARDVTLAKGADYTLSYANNVNAGAATVTVTGKGNYAGSIPKNFTIARQIVVPPTIVGKEYTGGHQLADVPSSTLYDIAQNAGGVEAGQYDVKLRLVDSANHAWPDVQGSDLIVKFTIDRKSIAGATVTLGPSLVYNSSEQEQAVESVKIDGLTATYTVSGNKATDVGTYTLTVTGTGNFSGTATAQWLIRPDGIVEAASPYDGVYDGEGHGIEVAVTKPDGAAVRYAHAANGPYTDDAILFTNVTEGAIAVWYTVEAENYTTVTNSATVKISPKSLTEEMVAVEETSYTYDGTAKEPTVTVADGEPSILTENDYEAVYSDNINAGTDTAKVTVTGKGNYTGSVAKYFTIAQAEVTPPASVASKTYTGELLKADVSATERYTVQNDGGVNAGNYPVTLTLTDSANYRWKDGNSNPLSLTFAITKAANAWTTQPSIAGWTYGQAASVPNMGTAKFGTATVTYSATPQNAGSYTATFTVPGTANYDGLSEPVHFEIAKATYDMSGARWSAGSFTYDGTEKSVVIEGLPAGVSVQSYANNAKTAAGNYTATVALNYDSTNYNAPTIGACDWSIAKKNIAGATVTLGPSLVYNSSEQEQAVESVKIDGLTATYTVSGNKATDVGTYTLTVTGTGNFSGTATAQWLIRPDGIVEAVTPYDGVFDGEGHGIEVAVTKPAGATVKYAYVANGPYVTDAILFTNVTADAIAVWYTVEAENYTTVTNSATVKISPKTLTGDMVSLEDVAYTYDGMAKTPTVTVKDGEPSILTDGDYDVVYSDNINAGTETAKITVTGKGNYTGTVNKWFSIAKATYDMSGAKWDYVGEFAYDGAEKAVRVSGLPSGVTVSYTGNMATAPGTYTAHAELSYDTTNYNKPEIADLVWVIKSAAETTLKEIFTGIPVGIEPDSAGGWKVTFTNDVDLSEGPIEIPDNLGPVTIDLGGHDLVRANGEDGGRGATALPGGDGKPAVKIVSGEGDGEPTVLTIVSTGGDATVKGGDGGAGNPGGNGAPAIEVADGAKDGVLINIGTGVTVQGGNGGASDMGRGGDGGAGIVGNVGTNGGTIIGGNGGTSDTGDGGNGGAGVDGNVDVNNGGISGGAGGGSEGGTNGDSGAGVTGDVGTDNGVVLPYALTEEMVGAIAPQPFTGAEVTPEVQVFDAARNRTLEEGTDYVLRWADNIRPGTASVTVTGKGNYLGEVTRTFAIGTPVEHTLTVGEYFYATLAELGYNVPTNGTPYSVVAKGLPAGLKLKYNPAWKNKKGKVIIKAKSEWWIEGVPTAAMDFFENPPYLVITTNGVAGVHALPIEVVAQDVKELDDLELGQSVNEQFYLPGVTNGWTVSGLPTGLKYTAKRITEKLKSGKQTKTVTKALPYSVYGKTTKAGLFTITAKKKKGAFYETMKYRVLVRPKEVDKALFGESLTNITTMAYVPVAWDLTGGGRGATALPGGGFIETALPMVSNVAKVAGLPTGLTFAATTTYKDKKKTQVKQLGQTIMGTPTKPGTYVVTFTKNVKSGKKTVAKTAQILWVVEPNDAKVELGFNTAGGVIENGVVGLKYGDLLAFSATEGATVKASGLPAGMKLVRVDGSAGGLALPGQAAWGFEGFTTKAGTYLVTVTATLNGQSVSQRLALEVKGLPTWAKGTFNGSVKCKMENGEGKDVLGLATVTVGATGKISGKFYESGTNWTFSAASYTGATSAAAPAQSGETPLPPGGTQSGETPLPPGGVTSAAAPAGFVCSNVVAKYSYKEKVKVKGKWKTVTKYVERTFNLAVSPVPVVPDVADVPVRGVVRMEEVGGRLGEAALPGEAGTEIEAWQNLWGSTYKAVGKALFTSKSGKKTLAYKTFTVDVYTNGVGEVTFIKKNVDNVDKTGLTCFATLSLKVTTAGAVTATLTYDTGKTKKDPKTKKMVKVFYKPTCQSVVVPLVAADAETFAGEVPLYFAPKVAAGFEGFAGSVVLP